MSYMIWNEIKNKKKLKRTLKICDIRIYKYDKRPVKILKGNLKIPLIERTIRENAEMQKYKNAKIKMYLVKNRNGKCKNIII